DQCYAAAVQARQTGWDGLVAAQREELDRYWAGADIELDGDDELALAARVALFHIHQAAYRAERRAIPAKGLTGTGYDGHAFWDTESYVMQVLAYTNPKAASDALRWRASTLDLALARARQLGLEGAAFPWRTIHGEECSGYWPASTAAFHVNADIADAVYRLHWVAEDAEFERSVGAPLVIHTARLWSSLGYFGGRDGEGDFHIDGVTGPDEYSAISNDNLYTNLLARRNLEGAAGAAERLPEVAAALGVTEDEVARWRAAAARMHVPFNPELGVHEQASGYTTRERWDFARTPPDDYPLLLHYPYFSLYRTQVVKQADLVFALLLNPMDFTAEEKRRAFEYYEPLTVRDSSLSASIQSVVAAEVGHLGLAYDYLCEAALLDLDDLEHNTSDGLHIASLAGTWIALVRGLGGLREHDGKLSFAPRLPDPLTRLCFRLTFRQRRLRVDVQPDAARYTIETGEPLVVRHHGEDVSLAKAETVARPIAPIPVLPAPSQPPGREPRGRTDQPTA
ncbi:MAG TPA: glycosyl hydrolase family 65 protein, partial [Solirubrobacteraceae bacterium]|nr:glycosyl hydrolase family 65 protein [Solirubrobacteraceae bacterium]